MLSCEASLMEIDLYLSVSTIISIRDTSLKQLTIYSKWLYLEERALLFEGALKQSEQP